MFTTNHVRIGVHVGPGPAAARLALDSRHWGVVFWLMHLGPEAHLSASAVMQKHSHVESGLPGVRRKAGRRFRLPTSRSLRVQRCAMHETTSRLLRYSLGIYVALRSTCVSMLMAEIPKICCLGSAMPVKGFVGVLNPITLKSMVMDRR
jgi:hypothetical protein